MHLLSQHERHVDLFYRTPFLCDRYVLVIPSHKRAPKGLEMDDLLEPLMPGSSNPCWKGYATALSAIGKSESLRCRAVFLLFRGVSHSLHADDCIRCMLMHNQLITLTTFAQECGQGIYRVEFRRRAVCCSPSAPVPRHMPQSLVQTRRPHLEGPSASLLHQWLPCLGLGAYSHNRHGGPQGQEALYSRAPHDPPEDQSNARRGDSRSFPFPLQDACVSWSYVNACDECGYGCCSGQLPVCTKQNPPFVGLHITDFRSRSSLRSLIPKTQSCNVYTRRQTALPDPHSCCLSNKRLHWMLWLSWGQVSGVADLHLIRIVFT